MRVAFRIDRDRDELGAVLHDIRDITGVPERPRRHPTSPL